MRVSESGRYRRCSHYQRRKSILGLGHIRSAGPPHNGRSVMRVGKQLAWGLLGVLAIIAMVAPLATAAELEGTVQSIDMSSQAITLGDGTKLVVVDAAQLQNVKPGMNVKASYEERAGQKIATSIKVERKGGAMPGASPAPTAPKQ